MTTLTEEARQQQLALRALTLRELSRLWPLLDVKRLEETYPGWFLSVARLVAQHRRISSVLSARYLREFRQQAGVAGEFTALLAPPVPPEQMATALRVTSLVAVRRALANGLDPVDALKTGFVSSSGAATRLVLDGGRDTIRGALATDPQAAGWTRRTSGTACAFCRLLAGRGAVYSARTADFAAHDHCSCSVVPVYGRGKQVQDYTPSQRVHSEADRRRLREALRQQDAS